MKESSTAILQQQAVLCRQSATAKVGNEVREKSIVSEENWKTGQRRRTDRFENITCKVNQRKGVIERECMRSGSRRE